MNRFNSSTKYIISVFFIILLFGGCSRFLKPPITQDRSHEELLANGIAKMEDKNYIGAIEAFQTIKDRYPYSKSAITAELKMADAYYRTKEYDSAFDVYDEFERLHPKDKNIPYVIFRKGMCHFKQIKTIDRDQTHTMMAREQFKRLVNRFPESDYANNATENIKECLVYLAEYELYVAHYYFKEGKYQPALERYMYIIKNYPDMGQYHQALEYISKCKEKLAAEVKENKS